MTHVSNISGSEGANHVPAEDGHFALEAGSVHDFYLDCDPRIQTCPDPQMTPLISLGAAALFSGIYDASVNDYQAAKQKLKKAKQLKGQIENILTNSSASTEGQTKEIKPLAEEMKRLFDEINGSAGLLHFVSGEAAIVRIESLLLISEAHLEAAKTDFFLAEHGVHPRGDDKLISFTISAADIGAARGYSKQAKDMLLTALRYEKGMSSVTLFMFRQLLVRAIQLNLQAWQEILRRDIIIAQENLEVRNRLDIKTTEDIVLEAEKALAKAKDDAEITDKLKTEIAYIFLANSLLKPSEKMEILNTIYQLGLAESEEEVLTRLSSGNVHFKHSLADFGVAEKTYQRAASEAKQIQTVRGEFLLTEGLSLLTKEKASEAIQKLAEAREFLQRNGIIEPAYLRTIANHAAALIAHADGLSKEREAGTGTGQIAAAYEAAMEEIGELARTHPAGILNATYTDAGGNEQRLMRLYAKAATGNRALTPDRSAVSAAPILGARDALLFELRHVSEKELATDEGKGWLKRCLTSLGVDGMLLGNDILTKLHTGDFDERLRIYLTAAEVESIKTKAEEAWLGTAFSGGRRGPRRDDRERGKDGAEMPLKK